MSSLKISVCAPKKINRTIIEFKGLLMISLKVWFYTPYYFSDENIKKGFKVFHLHSACKFGAYSEDLGI